MMRYNTIILCVIVEVGDMRRSGRIAAGLFLAAMLFAAGCGAAASEPAAPLPPAPSAPLPDGIPEPVRRALARTEADDVLKASLAAREKADAASFRETTLDDLESTRMSTTQKAIIVVAVLGVIAFAAWYLLAH